MVKVIGGSTGGGESEIEPTRDTDRNPHIRKIQTQQAVKNTQTQGKNTTTAFNYFKGEVDYKKRFS